MNSDNFREIINFAASTYNPPPATPRDAMWAAIQRSRQASPHDHARSAAASDSSTAASRMSKSSAGVMSVTRSSRPIFRAAPLTVRKSTGVSWRRRFLTLPIGAIAAAAVFLATGGQDISDPLPAELVSADGNLAAGNLSASYVARDPRFTQVYSVYSGAEMSPYVSAAGHPWYVSAADDPVNEAYRRAAIAHLLRSDSLITGFRTLGSVAVQDRRIRGTARELLSVTRLLIDSPVAARAQYKSVFEDLELVLVRMSALTPDSAAVGLADIERTLERKKLLARMRQLVPVHVSSNAN